MFSKINNITLLKNEPLCNHCSFRVGGNAKYFISAHNIDAILDTIYTCSQHSIQYKILGGGSNMLFDDFGYSGVIVKYDNNFKQIKNNILYASSGNSISELIEYTQQYNVGGLEFAIGVPALLGGAITNNLGAYNNDVSSYITQVTILRNNYIVYLSKDDCNFSYHSSNLQNSNSIILGATFNLPSQDKHITRTNALKYFNKRKTSQPLHLPNAGSIFKRTNDIIPAKLIDETHLKGLTIGNAQVSPKHAGFIVNLGNAKCSDILKLIELIKNKIYEKYKTNLQLEIEYFTYF
ncbi:MAG: UDP-N-acetylmuramate dehydrogenase [Clostridia bacterium]|nr:UDP-N-acetylmuramate dehydrogenase [Clostridia bacterium]